jgi:hypothetical protein
VGRRDRFPRPIDAQQIDAQHRGAEIGEQPWRVFRKVRKFDQGAGRGGAGTEQRGKPDRKQGYPESGPHRATPKEFNRP